MKIRHGFVSNSSSSSFIVAFPKKPKNAKDVLQFMFNGKEGGVGLEYYNDGLSYRQVAKIVFNDIKLGNAHRAGSKRLIEAMRSHYHYSPNRGSVHVMGEYDEDGGTWSQKRGRYYGSDRDLMEIFKKSVINHDKRQEEIYAEEREILSKANLGRRPPYAYKGGTDSYTKKPYTDEQIKASDAFDKAEKNFKETDPAWIALQKKERKMWDEDYQEMNEIQDKLAKIDSDNFLKDNKNAFIFIVDYGDEDSQNGAIMEHGNVFRNVPHIRISNH